jgi:hypothetical protein
LDRFHDRLNQLPNLLLLFDGVVGVGLAFRLARGCRGAGALIASDVSSSDDGSSCCAQALKARGSATKAMRILVINFFIGIPFLDVP